MVYITPKEQAIIHMVMGTKPDKHDPVVGHYYDALGGYRGSQTPVTDQKKVDSVSIPAPPREPFDWEPIGQAFAVMMVVGGIGLGIKWAVDKVKAGVEQVKNVAGLNDIVSPPGFPQNKHGCIAQPKLAQHTPECARFIQAYHQAPLYRTQITAFFAQHAQAVTHYKINTDQFTNHFSATLPETPAGQARYFGQLDQKQTTIRVAALPLDANDGFISTLICVASPSSVIAFSNAVTNAKDYTTTLKPTPYHAQAMASARCADAFAAYTR